MGKQWKQWQTNFVGSKITRDSDCSHEIKRGLLLERKAMTNLDSILKSRDIIFLTKVCLVKAMVFLVVMYGCESWTIKKAKKIKSVTVSIVSPSICHEVMGRDAMIFVVWVSSFKPAFSLSSFTFIKRLFNSSLLSAIVWCHLHIWGYWYFSLQSWFQLVLLPTQRFSPCTLHIS